MVYVLHACLVCVHVYGLMTYVCVGLYARLPMFGVVHVYMPVLYVGMSGDSIAMCHCIRSCIIVVQVGPMYCMVLVCILL